MSLRSLRVEWERREDLHEIAQRALLEEQQKARLQSPLPEIYQKCNNVHASFLFQPSWNAVLTTLCLKLCSFPSSSAGGWMDFAAHLSLDKDLINTVKHGNINIKQDNAFIVLKEYAKDDAATIGKIFRVLEIMKRYDIVNTISDLILDLCNNINTNQNSSLDGGYSSEENSSRTILIPVECKDTMIRHSCRSVATNETQSNSLNLFEGASQKSQETCTPHPTKESEKEPKKAQKHSRIVMLTFAEDGEAVAKELADALRSSADRHGRSVGVVTLGENKYLIADDPCIKITNCFNQVDFVIPIITKKYISRCFPSAVENGEPTLLSPSIHPDAYYAPLILRLMSTEYTHQHCLNIRFRSVIPSDDTETLFAKHSVMNIPFLSPWCLSRDAVAYPRRALLLSKKARVIQKLTA